MKTKILFIALAASLLVFTGCSKKDKNTFSWTNQFKTIENYIGQDSATVVQQLINDGYTFEEIDEDELEFEKKDAENGTTFGYLVELNSNKKVEFVLFIVGGTNVPEEYTSTDGFVDLVKSIGAQYTSAYNTVYKFTKCSYENTKGAFNETDFAKLENNLAAIANDSPHLVWDGSNDSEIDIQRDLEKGFTMRLAIADGNVK